VQPLLWRWGDPIAVGALLILPLVIFLRAALLRGVFYIHDIQYYFYPYHALTAALLGRGELPLWNSYAFSGIPLLGDGQTAIFYPPNWLFFLLPGGAALNYDVMLQFSIAGIGLYLFARSLGLWRAPSFLGAVAYMFCGFLTARVVHLSILSGAALLPLVFLCVERALRSRTRRWFVAAAGAAALQALAGHPQVPIYTALALGLYTLIRAIERWYRDRSPRWLYRLPLWLAAIYVLGYALAAVQLAPWVELGSFSPRAAGASFDFVFSSSMAGSNWLLFLFPYLYGSLGSGIYAAKPLDIMTSVKLWEHSAYVGILPLALAMYGLLGLGYFPRRTVAQDGGSSAPSRRSPTPTPSALAGGRESWFSLCFFALLLLVGLVLSSGKYTPFARLIYAMPVVGKLRDVERGLVLVAFALTMLAAFGMQRVIDATARQGRMRQTSLLVIAIMIVLLPVTVIWLGPQPWFRRVMNLPAQEVANLQLGRPNAALPLALALLSAALLLWWSQRGSRAVGQALAVGLVVVDMAAYAAAFNPNTDPQLFQRKPDVLAAFQAPPFRKATFLEGNELDNRTAQETLAVSWGMVYGVQDINGFNSLQPRRYTDYLFGPKVDDVSYGILDNPGLLRPESPILNALNVRYVLVPSNLYAQMGPNFRQVYENRQVRVYENTQAYPRAYFADTVRAETDQQAVLRTVTANGFDGQRLALVEAPQAPALPPPASASARADATITEYRANQITLTTSTAEQRFLVLSEMYFPGWHALIDGAETPIYRSNYLFRGIVVPAGQHTVTFVYRPVSAVIGAAISAGALLVIGGLLLLRPRRGAAA
jgi:hypothetical protein